VIILTASPRPAGILWSSRAGLRTGLRVTPVFLVIALVAAALGFGGIAATAVGIAKVLFYISLALFLIALIAGLAARKEDLILAGPTAREHGRLRPAVEYRVVGQQVGAAAGGAPLRARLSAASAGQAATPALRYTPSTSGLKQANTTSWMLEPASKAPRTAVTAMSVAGSSGYPKIPVLIAGKAMLTRPCSAARSIAER
jgi:uncharacterized membrane protein YtjA (UPF0391 family)